MLHSSSGAAPPPAPEALAAETPATEASAADAYASSAGAMGQAPSGFGAETPLPGREKEYEAFKAQAGAAGAALFGARLKSDAAARAAATEEPAQDDEMEEIDL